MFWLWIELGYNQLPSATNVGITHLGNYEKHKNMNGHAIKTVAHQQQTHE